MEYDEQYGDLTRPQKAAYRKYNVSPADHFDLIDEFGENNRTAIVAAVKDRSPNGYYNFFWRH